MLPYNKSHWTRPLVKIKKNCFIKFCLFVLFCFVWFGFVWWECLIWPVSDLLVTIAKLTMNMYRSQAPIFAKKKLPQNMCLIGIPTGSQLSQMLCSSLMLHWLSSAKEQHSTWLWVSMSFNETQNFQSDTYIAWCCIKPSNENIAGGISYTTSEQRLSDLFSIKPKDRAYSKELHKNVSSMT